MTTKLTVIPKGHRIQNVGGTNFLVPKTRSRRRFKLPKTTRDRMRASARKLKIPIVQGSLVGYGVFDAVQQGMAYQSTGTGKFRRFLDTMLSNYTGWNNLTQEWKPTRAKGALGVAGWFLMTKTGLFAKANQMLGRYRVPVVRL